MIVRYSSCCIRTFNVHLVVVALFLLILSGVLMAEKSCKIPAIYNFGDSNSDTGSESATFGRLFYPYGITFFGGPSGRYSDGRLIIDVFADRLGLPFLSSYLDAIEANFTHGANFAVSSGSIQPVDGELFGTGLNPLALNLQLLQFQQLMERTSELQNRANSSIVRNKLPRVEDFSNALYTLDIGQNDITVGLLLFTDDQLPKLFHRLINHLASAIKTIYQFGGRKFWIHNTGPLGCLPLALKLGFGKKDEIGCIEPYNEAAQQFNRLLKKKLTQLRAHLKQSVLIYVDIYSAKYSLIRNAKANGFVHPFSYCCQNCNTIFRTPYWKRGIANYGEISTTSCDNPSEYISWDGVHYTEAANRLVVNQILDGSLTHPSMPFGNLCG